MTDFVTPRCGSSLFGRMSIYDTTRPLPNPGQCVAITTADTPTTKPTRLPNSGANDSTFIPNVGVPVYKRVVVIHDSVYCKRRCDRVAGSESALRHSIYASAVLRLGVNPLPDISARRASNYTARNVCVWYLHIDVSRCGCRYVGQFTHGYLDKGCGVRVDNNRRRLVRHPPNDLEHTTALTSQRPPAAGLHHNNHTNLTQRASTGIIRSNSVPCLRNILYYALYHGKLVDDVTAERAGTTKAGIVTDRVIIRTGSDTE
ncbi:hypothetical protein EVAR_19894_1 [Eumeta japonica]|uniref:Uncharacterized protein n=1 Tax=Eumeta variegata TaxID=151549 RepID=A0A4C1XN61_EUMVA|nr:hypothetical protein EVAR_19894_1 [Eumeta japonica]